MPLNFHHTHWPCKGEQLAPMFLGIEIGGTKLQLGLGDGDGTLHALVRATVVPADGADGIRRRIEAAIPELLASAKRKRDELKGVGIGFGGPVDDATRAVIKSHQIAGWDGFPLADWIADLVGVPAVLGNDADVAGLAEALFGAGKGLSPIFYITIGSGIGGGLILNGEIYRGCGRGAAEIGHLGVNSFEVKPIPESFRRDFPSVPEHYTTSRLVPLESVASGWALGRLMRERLEKCDAPSLFRSMSQGERENLTGSAVGQAAQQGDVIAQGVLDDSIEWLAEAVSQMITLLCPRRIIIGGGVAFLGEKRLFEPLRESVAGRVFKPFADCYDIVPAALGVEVVVHGALALAKKRLGM
jgi:glucokinase